jgi:cellobiose-specific phosphotransferase system component IIC
LKTAKPLTAKARGKEQIALLPRAFQLTPAVHFGFPIRLNPALFMNLLTPFNSLIKGLLV